MQKNAQLKPIVKWVGGKRQLLDDIRPLIPTNTPLYVEPFVGGGAVLFDLQPTRALVNDSNEELINVYRVVRDNPEALLDALKLHEQKNAELGSTWFYQVRSLDRTSGFSSLGSVERAARIIYLNKTCYNGLFRVNSAGQLNVPYGRYKHPNIVNEQGIRALSTYLNEASITLACGDFANVLRNLPQDSFVYLDPPYVPVTATSTFTGYTQEGFGYEEQVRLRDECVLLREQGIGFLESNSDCKEVRDLYKDFTISTVHAKRSINSKASRRGPVGEVLIRG